ncbi:MAG TPA: dihydrolipoamide acetyltransferase family protein [Microlunatus sp.]|nr:dihydrolipoamide acetyltransferase family protein [Microlunatus sp.]
MTIKEFRLPDPGEGLVEADIVTWHVKVGDQVKINDIVVEVETSKSLVELPIPFEGTVEALLVKEGDTVDVGTPIIRVDDGVSAPTNPANADMVPAAPAAEGDGDGESEARVPNLVGYGPRATSSKRRPRKGPAGADPNTEEAHAQIAERSFAVDVPVSRRADHREALPPHQAEPVGGPLPHPGVVEPFRPTGGAAVLAKPPVRKLAKDLGVDLESVGGSGPGGVITRDDVEQAAAGPAEPEIAAAPLVSPAAGGGETRIPIKGVRKATAKAMVDSAFTAPHVTEWVTCDVTATMELIDRLKARRDFRDVKITPMLLVAKAVCLAIQRTPGINASWDDATQEIVLHHDVNLGIAAATPRGLLVPNIKQAQRLDLRGLADAFAQLVSTARDGRTQPADMAGGTFTITNVGVFGVDGGTPILNPGESGILCVGQIARRPWVVGTGDDERIVPRWVTTLGVSFDHRLVDGEQGSTFLSDVATVLSDPGQALLF